MSPAWADALRVARLAAADPHGCGGVLVRAGAGPVRDLWLDHLAGELGPGRPLRRMPAGIADDRLLGGLDLTATLAAGRPIAQSGLLAEADGGCVVVPMAERLSPGTAARLAAALDAGEIRAERDGLAARAPARIGLILLDEGEGDDARVPEALADRLAFRLDLTGIAWGDTRGDRPEPAPDPAAPDVDPDGAVADLCAVAAELGILSLRAPLLALRVARLLAGGRTLRPKNLREAACLVLAPRAMRLPPSPEEAQAAPPERPEPPAPDESAPSDAGLEPGAESLVEAARAAIPPDLLARLAQAGSAPSSPKAGRVGAVMQAPRSGRPAGTRPGSPRAGRLALLPTLRAAAPWQRLRTGAQGAPRLIEVRSADFRITRFRQRSETTTIFAVDASGSAALERLAEAKGAVELLLAEAYVRRDRVALVAFRGSGAEVVLAPTRALARARRGLSALPGGGGTPLAAGLDAAVDLARAVRRGGGTPVVVVLTDGRANIARSGAPGRAAAGAEALNAAGLLRAADIRSILIDTAARPQEAARRLAEAMGARYVPLPYADAAAMSTAIRSAR
ncbi:magnesium chelatase ATPase subunit D [Methylobacterium sp. Leaf104]|uniref:magnesium chelatase subunit D n=1 Tax=Methylobacterium TaxID=407 RepID=UPI0006FA4F0E|nr:MULTISPECIES: magnesium chelatase subunit D [Methylobacterium]KQP42900.1 magnesium chelatase ATPase subunit D [Methylobacterium sp. Leaf104]MCI9878496.1 magnesium chelatase subunit D [Methylobacterium goesingense]